MNKWLIFVLLAFTSSNSLAFLCYDYIIMRGSHTDSVYDLCGEPDEIEFETEYIDPDFGPERHIRPMGYLNDQPKNYTHGLRLKRRGLRLKRRGLRLKNDADYLVPIHYEIWTYYFGQAWPMYYLHFRNDILFSIEEGDYNVGYNCYDECYNN